MQVFANSAHRNVILGKGRKLQHLGNVTLLLTELTELLNPMTLPMVELAFNIKSATVFVIENTLVLWLKVMLNVLPKSDLHVVTNVRAE
jgi:hypothetical protein